VTTARIVQVGTGIKSGGDQAKRKRAARSQWLTPVIPATQDAEIRRITV
jgi:hypothetical protein